MPETEASDLMRGFRPGDRGSCKGVHVQFRPSARRSIIVVCPVFAQYGGPAILARGRSPASMTAGQIDFRPVSDGKGQLRGRVERGGGGLEGRSGQRYRSYGVSVGFGISGAHSWKHTRLGLNYSSGFSHYAKSLLRRHHRADFPNSACPTSSAGTPCQFQQQRRYSTGRIARLPPCRRPSSSTPAPPTYPPTISTTAARSP